MYSDSLETLHERFERLVLRRPKSSLTEAEKRAITDKFANKTLQELHDIVLELDKKNDTE